MSDRSPPMPARKLRSGWFQAGTWVTLRRFPDVSLYKVSRTDRSRAIVRAVALGGSVAVSLRLEDLRRATKKEVAGKITEHIKQNAAKHLAHYPRCQACGNVETVLDHRCQHDQKVPRLEPRW